jgi:hypothetical protein
MIQIKITSDKIEEIFLFMNFFKPNELIKPEYKRIEGYDFPHTLYVTLAAIKESSFINRAKKFDKLHKNLLTVEVLEYKPQIKSEDLNKNKFFKIDEPVWSELVRYDDVPGENLLDDLIQNMVIELTDKRDLALKKIILERLSLLKIEFNSDEEFVDFSKKRLTKVGFDEEGLYQFDVFLDYVSPEEWGTLIVSFNTKMEMDIDGYSGTATMTLG